jgi:hypothetical protein
VTKLAKGKRPYFTFEALDSSDGSIVVSLQS